MPSKKTNIMEYIEPNLKKQAEKVLHNLGIPVSFLLTSLYRQIVLTREIPFPIEMPNFICFDQLSKEEFIALIEEADRSAEEEGTIPMEKVFEELRINL